jgi:hypothetical protein
VLPSQARPEKGHEPHAQSVRRCRVLVVSPEPLQSLVVGGRARLVSRSSHGRPEGSTLLP